MNLSKNELYKRHNNPILAKQKFYRRTDFTNIGIPKRKNYYIGGDSTPIYYNYWYNSIIPIRDTILVPVPIAYDELNYVSVIKKEQQNTINNTIDNTINNTIDNTINNTIDNTIDTSNNEEIELMTEENNDSVSTFNNYGLIILLLIIFYLNSK